jgi:hypothetical protein
MTAQQQRPGCPGCGGLPATERGLLFCTLCWVDVPEKARKALDRARKALGRNPSGKVRTEFELALSDAAGYVR